MLCTYCQTLPSSFHQIQVAFLLPLRCVDVSGLFSALHVPPSWSFSIDFSEATFLPYPGGLDEFSFSAQLDNEDLIPDWLGYNYVWRCYSEGKTMGLRF